ncbi:MAG: TonB dependent receptor [Candidatus Kapabacteria bacterium]|nr:TonB dependent receptor [Candidatus Kapabacteria bacterium]
MKFTIKIVLVFLFCQLSLFSQEGSLTGKVVDSESSKAIRDATVSIITIPDSSRSTQSTSQSGDFSFDEVKRGKYLIRITHVAYMPIERIFDFDGKSLDMGNLFLLPASSMTDEVTVTGQSVTAELMGDTTQFNASAFKTTQDASAEDLVRKMPGVIVEDGQTKTQGETIKEVLVDGRPFMGDDPTAALKNLPAEMIDKIQVFDRRSDQAAFTGNDDGETSKTLNIITRADMRNASFGKVYAGYGTDDRYNAGGIVNFFSGDSRFAILFQTNNLNNQNFASEDLLGVMGASSGRGLPPGARPGGRRPGGGGSLRRGGADINDFMVSQQSGIVTTNAFGINYSDNWTENFEVTGSYFLNHTENDRREDILREYILNTPESQRSEEISESLSYNWNHRFNMRIKYNIDSSNYMIIRPRMSFQSNDGVSLTNTGLQIDNQLANNTQTDFDSQLKGMNLSNDLFYGHRFAKKGRVFSVQLSTSYNENSGDNRQKSIFEEYYDSDFFSDSLSQFGELDKNGYEIETELEYTEPLFEFLSIQFEYENTMRRDKSDKLTYIESNDPETLLMPVVSPTLSSMYESDLMTHVAGVSLRYNNAGLMASLRMNNEWNTLENASQYPNSFDEKRQYNNILPRFFMRYEFDKESNLRMFYRNRVSLPSIDQLQVVLNNSNPMNLSTGNTNLNESSRHDLMIRYSKVNQQNSDMFFAMMAFGKSDSYISKNTFIAARDTMLYEGINLPAGGQFTFPINIDGFNSMRSFLSYGKYVGLLKSNVNLTGSFDFSQIPSIINEQRNVAESKNISLNAVVSSNISTELDFTVSTTSMLNYVTNSLVKDLNSDYFIQKSSLRLNWIFLGGFVVESNFEHQYYKGLSEAINPNVYLWNLSFGRKFLKDNRAELRITAFDVLKQNNAITRNISDSYIDDVRSNVLQQYFLLNFTYNLRIYNL